MSQHLQREIERLKKAILSLSTVAEENLRRAVDAVMKIDPVLAREAVEADAGIDQREVEIEEECLKVLALHQPVAQDLRFLVGVLKVNQDLERIGDMAVNIAERVLLLQKQGEQPGGEFDFHRMAEKVQEMLRLALDAFVRMDGETARRVCRMDDAVDAINRDTYRQVREGIRANGDRVDAMIHYLGISRSLERVADHCTNIAEDVIYMAQGNIIRHDKGALNA